MRPGSGERIHASAVAFARQAVMLTGPSGCGKSRLALALIADGAMLVGDDQLEATVAQGRIWLSPPARLQGLIEVAGIGIHELPWLRRAPLRLVVRLSGPGEEPGERLPEPDAWRLGEVAVPAVRLCADDPAAAAKVRAAFLASPGVAP
ncbi:MAG: HPr kinase [Rhodothalassiaceae bacterium]|nr:MAG: HPr kinase [Rhodothalassiaceae bacterium]